MNIDCLLSLVKVFIIMITLLIATCQFSKAENKKDGQMQKNTNLNEGECPYDIHTEPLLENICVTGNHSNGMPDEENEIDVLIVYTKYMVVALNEPRNTISLDVTQAIQWHDPRIMATKNMSFPMKKIGRIWIPYPGDMVTYDLQEEKSLYHPNQFKKVLVEVTEHNDTWFAAWRKWRVTIFCKYNLSSFPFDTQTCKFRQQGAQDNLYLILFDLGEMEAEGTELDEDEKPDPTSYAAAGFDVTINVVGAYDHENYAAPPKAVGFDIILKRFVNPYVFEYYLPSFAIVIVSQISFTIPISSIPGRVALIATNFLTLTEWNAQACGTNAHSTKCI